MNFYPSDMYNPNMIPSNNNIFNKINELENRIKKLEQRIILLENEKNNKSNYTEQDNGLYMI